MSELYTPDEIRELEKDFKKMKKQQWRLVELAEDKGYEFSDLELSIVTKIGRADNWRQVSNFVCYSFAMFYPIILSNIKKKR